MDLLNENHQFDIPAGILDEEFKIFPNVIISYIDQNDIGDEILLQQQQH